TTMSRPRLLLLVPLFAWLPLGTAHAAAPDGGASWCGTGPAQQVISAAKHLQFQRLERRARGELALATSATRVYRSGRVAVIEGDDRLVAGPNPFDLPDQGIQFLRRAAGYRTQRWPRPMFTAIGERLELDDEGSVAVDFPGWEFPFHGRSWARVYVNANGNLTFGEPSDTWHT
ncbi:MAG: hypothetical protein GY856_51465, partial [bacterium]|nr:hypothetical protein [bacterium]